LLIKEVINITIISIKKSPSTILSKTSKLLMVVKSGAKAKSIGMMSEFWNARQRMKMSHFYLFLFL